MKQFVSLGIKNKAIGDTVCRDIMSGTLSHAYIIEGELGADTLNFAMLISAALACGSRSSQMPLPCRICAECEKILSNNCPDILFVEPDGGSIKVDMIRELKSKVILSPNELKFKAVIIKEAEKMTEQAQNALLKILEEPPQYTYFFLLSSNSSFLLPTILSRAPILHLSAPTREDIISYIRTNAPTVPPKEAEKIAAAAKGDERKAKEMISGSQEGKECLACYNSALSLMEFLAKEDKKSEYVLYFAQLSQKKESIKEILRLLYSAFRDIIATKRSKNASLDFYPDKETAIAHGKGITMKCAAVFSEYTEEALSALLSNSLSKPVLYELCIKLHRAKSMHK